MDELIKKIYMEVILYEDDVLKSGKQLDKEVADLLKTYEDELDEKHMEIVKTLMYQTILIAEQEGFWLGIKYAVKLMVEILSD